MTLGMFLATAAACPMWASRDLVNRAPIVFWQGLVRLTAVASVLYAAPHQLSEQWECALVFMRWHHWHSLCIGHAQGNRLLFLRLLVL